ncbi:AbrB family transcriptional regulator [Nocardia testacea]|uniref:AbrB family transcriptional regulator n=1 Tax=Nocardia testacea TaxID=248551 RepID=A0ABW7VR86_9NOCA
MTAWRRWSRTTARWCALVAATLLGWAVFARLGVAAPELFASLLIAMLLALAGVGPLRPGRPLMMAAQGALAVSIGLSVQPETLAALGTHWPLVAGSAVVTLVLSVLAGFALSRHREVDPVTGVLGMIAGGATGLVAAAGELGADERIVVVVQYLRVALVVLSMPLVVTYLFAPDAAAAPAPPATTGVAPWWADLLFLVGAVVVGTGVATLARLPIPATLGPLFLAGAAELGGWAEGVAVPVVVLPAAFLVIGWQAGSSFSRESLAAIGRIFGWALALMIALTAACGGTGLLLSRWTGLSALEGYLATTPGGLAAVLAVAGSSPDADVTFVAAAQIIRLVLMLVSAPVLVWALRRWIAR